MCQIEEGHLFDATVAVVTPDSFHPRPPPSVRVYCVCAYVYMRIFFRRRNFTADDRAAAGFRDWHASMTGTVSCHSSLDRAAKMVPGTVIPV